MGARGPKPGCGANTAQVIYALASGPKTHAELVAVTKIADATLKVVLNRMHRESKCIQVAEEMRRGVDRKAWVYELAPGVQFATSTHHHSTRVLPPESRVVRPLEEAFHAIVSGRAAPT